MTNLERWRLYMQDIESPDSYIDWVFYHTIASALQRRVWFYSDPITHMPGVSALFPNFFVVLVGPPATGKSRAISFEGAVVKHHKMQIPGIDGKLAQLIPYMPDTATQEAIIGFLAKDCIGGAEIPYVDKEGVEKKKNYIFHAAVFVIEELGVLLRNKTEDIVNMLNAFYDSRDYRYKTKHQGDDVINSLCVNIIAGTTADFIREAYNKGIVSQGFTSRVIFVYADAPRFYRVFNGFSVEQQRAFNEVVDHVKKLQSVCGEVVMSPEAEAWWKQKYESGEMMIERLNKDPRLDNYYGRKNIHWRKLCMILLYSDQTESNVVTLDIAIRAYNILSTVEVRMHEAFKTSGRNVFHDIMQQMIRFVGEKGKASFKRLLLEFSRDLTKEELEQCLDILQTTGQLDQSNGLFYVNGKQPTTTTTSVPAAPSSQRL